MVSLKDYKNWARYPYLEDIVDDINKNGVSCYYEPDELAGLYAVDGIQEEHITCDEEAFLMVENRLDILEGRGAKFDYPSAFELATELYFKNSQTVWEALT